MNVNQEWADSLRQLDEYAYQKSGQGQSVLWWIFEALYDLWRQMFNDEYDGLSDLLGYALMTGCIVVAIYLIATKAKVSPFYRTKRVVVKHTEELATVEDYDRLIGTAISDGEYRAAVRLMYQQILSELQEAGDITWRANKTDAEYVQEFRQSGKDPSRFADVVRKFQLIWYGKRDLTELEFQEAQRTFNGMRSSLGSANP